MTVQLADRPVDGPAPPANPRLAASLGDAYFGRRTWAIDAVCLEAASCGFRPAAMAELPAAHAFCERIMGMRLAPLWALASAHAHTTGSAWVHSDPGGLSGGADPTGVFLFLPLNWEGEAALRIGRFNYAAPRIDHLCAPGDETAAIYFWFCGGCDRTARRAVMRTTQAWLDGAFAGLRIYGRAASEDGARGFDSFGFKRLAPERADLFILDKHR